MYGGRPRVRCGRDANTRLYIGCGGLCRLQWVFVQIHRLYMGMDGDRHAGANGCDDDYRSSPLAWL